MKCQCWPHIETSELICYANQSTGFYMRATLALDGLMTLFHQKHTGSTIKTLVNGKKVPVIPPILVNNKLVTNFKGKAIFNDFFSKQWWPKPSNTTLPSIQTFKTSNRLSADYVFSSCHMRVMEWVYTL